MIKKVPSIVLDTPRKGSWHSQRQKLITADITYQFQPIFCNQFQNYCKITKTSQQSILSGGEVPSHVKNKQVTTVIKIKTETRL